MVLGRANTPETLFSCSCPLSAVIARCVQGWYLTAFSSSEPITRSRLNTGLPAPNYSVILPWLSAGRHSCSAWHKARRVPAPRPADGPAAAGPGTGSFPWDRFLGPVWDGPPGASAGHRHPPRRAPTGQRRGKTAGGRRGRRERWCRERSGPNGYYKHRDAPRGWGRVPWGPARGRTTGPTMPRAAWWPVSGRLVPI